MKVATMQQLHSLAGNINLNLMTKTGEEQEIQLGGAIDHAFENTGVSKDQFTPTKSGVDQNGKSFPVEWKGPKGAEVSIDLAHIKNGPDVPHVEWQGPGKGAPSGHILRLL
jgi:hypothetical protein